MLQIIFSDHAIFQIQIRNIPKELVVETVNFPDKIILQTDGRFKVIKLYKNRGKKYLSVVIYQKIKMDKKIITVFITSKINKYLL